MIFNIFNPENQIHFLYQFQNTISISYILNGLLTPICLIKKHKYTPSCHIVTKNTFGYYFDITIKKNIKL